MTAFKQGGFGWWNLNGDVLQVMWFFIWRRMYSIPQAWLFHLVMNGWVYSHISNTSPLEYTKKHVVLTLCLLCFLVFFRISVCALVAKTRGKVWPSSQQGILTGKESLRMYLFMWTAWCHWSYLNIEIAVECDWSCSCTCNWAKGEIMSKIF